MTNMPVVRKRLFPTPGALLLLAGASPVTANEIESMNHVSPTLWQAIDMLGRQAPLTPSKVQEVLGSTMQLDSQTDFKTRWVGHGVALRDGVSITQSGLTLLAETQRTRLGLWIGGECLTRAALEAQYGALKLVAKPRGQSPMESSVWESQQPWGQLHFAFQVSNPTCVDNVMILPGA